MSEKPNYTKILHDIVAEQFSGKLCGKARAAAGKQFQAAKKAWEEETGANADADANGPQLCDALELVERACNGGGTERQRTSIAKRIYELQRKAYFREKWEQQDTTTTLEAAMDDLSAQAAGNVKRARVED